jgi:hypothetical protein
MATGFLHGESGDRPRRYRPSGECPGAAEALGLKVEYNITKGAWVRQIPRDEAEIAIECLRDWAIAARIRECAAPNLPADALDHASVRDSQR